MNPLLVQEMLGHATLDMTRRYTHLGIEAKREAMGKLGPAMDVVAGHRGGRDHGQEADEAKG